jgi:hypothetical protein
MRPKPYKSSNLIYRNAVSATRRVKRQDQNFQEATMKRFGHIAAGTALLLLASVGIASGQERPPSAIQPMPQVADQLIHGPMGMGSM